MAIAHFAVGVTGTVVLCRLFAADLLRSPTVFVAGGLWAVLPDAHWVLPVGVEPVWRLHHSPVANLFWAHRWIDGIDPSNSRRFAALTIAVMCVVVFVGDLSQRYRTEPRSGESV